VIAAKFREAWRGLIVAVVLCITTSHCLFLTCVLLICSSFGWFCGWLGHWVASSSATHLSAASRARYRMIGLVGLGNTVFEGLDFLKPAEPYLYSMHHTLCSWWSHTPKIKFSLRNIHECGVNHEAIWYSSLHCSYLQCAGTCCQIHC